jgi:hypothetical protein
MALLPIQLGGDQVGDGRIAAGQGSVDRVSHSTLTARIDQTGKKKGRA